MELGRYLSPGVPGVGRDENADVGVGELRPDHAWTQRRPRARKPDYCKGQSKSLWKLYSSDKSEDGDRRGTAAEERLI